VRRRAFITLLGGAATWPLAARAQQPGNPPTIGVLGSDSAAWSHLVSALMQRLRELGWIENRTIAIEYRWTKGRNEHYAAMAAELVGLKADIIVALGTPAIVSGPARRCERRASPDHQPGPHFCGRLSVLCFRLPGRRNYKR